MWQVFGKFERKQVYNIQTNSAGSSKVWVKHVALSLLPTCTMYITLCATSVFCVVNYNVKFPMEHLLYTYIAKMLIVDPLLAAFDTTCSNGLPTFNMDMVEKEPAEAQSRSAWLNLLV